MLTALIATALIESATLAPRPMACAFPAKAPDQDHIEIEMTARPSLKDLPGLFRVRMSIDGRALRASAQPIGATKDRDVLIRATRSGTVHYALGVDERGLAALNVVLQGETGDAASQTTRIGRCRGHERYIRNWTHH